MSALRRFRQQARRAGRKLATQAETFIAEKKRHPEWTPVQTGERIRVVFIVLTPQVWPSVEPVWRRLSEDDRFETKVVVVEKSIEADSLSELRAAYDLLIGTGIPFIKASSFSMRRYKPHVVFYPLPYNSLYPHAFRLAPVQKTGARVAYVPYGLETGGGAHNAVFQYDQPILREAWRVFARSQRQAENFARYCATGNAHVVVTGHPRGSLQPETCEKLPDDTLVRAKDRKIIAWSSHFSVNSRRKWSSFLENHESILAEVDKRPDLFFVFRPHPFLERELRSVEGWSAKRVHDLFEAIAARENVCIDRNAAYRPLFNSSDALMTDPGSFLAEYLLIDKPICLLSGSDGIGLSQEVAAYTAFEKGDTTENISGFLDIVTQGSDAKHADRLEARKAYFGNMADDPAELIAREIVRSVSDRPFRKSNAPSTSSHRAALRYWTHAKSTFLAPEDYYAKQEKVLTELLDRLDPEGFAIDVGCGNGRFTELFAKYCTFVEGIDPSKALVAEAAENARLKGIHNLEYRRESIEKPRQVSAYDLVSCMGVLSGLTDNEKFIQASHWLRAATKPNGRLILKESLSVGSLQSVEMKGYVAVYRNINDYLDVFRSAGFTLVDEITIAPVDEKGMTNRLFVLDAVEQRIGV